MKNVLVGLEKNLNIAVVLYKIYNTLKATSSKTKPTIVEPIKTFFEVFKNYRLLKNNYFFFLKSGTEEQASP